MLELYSLDDVAAACSILGRRRAAYEALRQLWELGGMSPRASYRFAAAVLGLAAVNVAELDSDQCEILIARCERALPWRKAA